MAVLSLASLGAFVAPAAAQTPPMTSAPQSQPAASAPEAAAAPPQGAAPPPAQPWAQPPAGYPAPPYAIAPNGQYVAPLSQTTQPVYVPQSVALSGPRVLKDWRDGEPIPWGYHRVERVRKGEIISGAILFGVPYLYSTFIAGLGSDVSSSRDNPVGWLYLPVLGPFIELKNSDSAAANELLVIDGVLQGVGAALFIHGMSTPRPMLVRNDLALLSVSPAPMGKDGTGMMFLGTF